MADIIDADVAVSTGVALDGQRTAGAVTIVMAAAIDSTAVASDVVYVTLLYPDVCASAAVSADTTYTLGGVTRAPPAIDNSVVISAPQTNVLLPPLTVIASTSAASDGKIIPRRIRLIPTPAVGSTTALDFGGLAWQLIELSSLATPCNPVLDCLIEADTAVSTAVAVSPLFTQDYIAILTFLSSYAQFAGTIKLNRRQAVSAIPSRAVPTTQLAYISSSPILATAVSLAVALDAVLSTAGVLQPAAISSLAVPVSILWDTERLVEVAADLTVVNNASAIGLGVSISLSALDSSAGLF